MIVRRKKWRCYGGLKEWILGGLQFGFGRYSQKGVMCRGGVFSGRGMPFLEDFVRMKLKDDFLPALGSRFVH